LLIGDGLHQVLVWSGSGDGGLCGVCAFVSASVEVTIDNLALERGSQNNTISLFEDGAGVSVDALEPDSGMCLSNWLDRFNATLSPG